MQTDRVLGTDNMSSDRVYSDRLTCCVPGCAHTATRRMMADCIEMMCDEHYALASPSAVARRTRSEERLKALQECWDDDTYFDRLVASGKYLKMCGTLSLASDSADRAWRNLKAEVLAASKPRASAKVSAGLV